MHIVSGVPTLPNSRLELAVAVEDLDALVAGIGDVDIALRVDTAIAFTPRNWPGPGAGRSPLRDELAVLVELGDAVVGADAVGDVDVAGLVPRHVGRTAEGRARECRTWRAAACAVRHLRRPPRARAPAPPPRPRHRGAGCRRATTPPATAAAAGRAGGRTPIASGLRPSTSADAAIGVELHHLAGALVDRPDVVLRIDAQADRGVEAVDVLAPLAHELAGLIEQEQARAALR